MSNSVVAAEVSMESVVTCNGFSEVKPVLTSKGPGEKKC